MERQRPDLRVGGTNASGGMLAAGQIRSNAGRNLVKHRILPESHHTLVNYNWSNAGELLFKTGQNGSKLVKTDQTLAKSASAGRGRGRARRAPLRRLSRAYLTSVWPVFDHILTSIRPAFDQYLTSVVSARLALVPPAADPRLCERASDRARARAYTHTQSDRARPHTHTHE